MANPIGQNLPNLYYPGVDSSKTASTPACSRVNMANYTGIVETGHIYPYTMVTDEIDMSSGIALNISYNDDIYKIHDHELIETTITVRISTQACKFI